MANNDMTDPREDDGPATPRQYDVIAAIEEIRGAATLAKMAADSSARRSHYNGEQLESIRGMVLALGGDVADISAALVRIEKRLGITESMAERASDTNEVVNDLARLHVDQQQIAIIAKRLRNETLWYTMKVAAMWIFSGAGLASVIVAAIMTQC